jgi:protease PrsW
VPDISSIPFYFFLHLLQVVVVLVLLRYLDLYERESFGVIAALFAWGGIGATFLSLQGNTFLLSRLPEDLGVVFGPALTAPVVEELAKGLALLAAFGVAHVATRRMHLSGFQGLADGVVYGAAVGLGFAFTENILFFIQFAAIEGSLLSGLEVFLLRVDFVGLQGLLHGVFSALFGAGLGLAVWSRSWLGKVGFPLLGLVAAMLMHASWNGLPQLLLVIEYGFDTVAGALAGQPLERDLVAQLEASFQRAFTVSRWVYYISLALVLVAFALWLRYERQIIRYELADEVRAGVLSQEEWELLPQFWRRSAWYLRLLREGRALHMSAVSRLHSQLVNLALLKWRARRLGQEVAHLSDARSQIEAHRAYIVALASPPPAAGSASSGNPPVLPTAPPPA